MTILKTAARETRNLAAGKKIIEGNHEKPKMLALPRFLHTDSCQEVDWSSQ